MSFSKTDRAAEAASFRGVSGNLSVKLNSPTPRSAEQNQTVLKFRQDPRDFLGVHPAKYCFEATDIHKFRSRLAKSFSQKRKKKEHGRIQKMSFLLFSE